MQNKEEQAYINSLRLFLIFIGGVILYIKGTFWVIPNTGVIPFSIFGAVAMIYSVMGFIINAFPKFFRTTKQ